MNPPALSPPPPWLKSSRPRGAKAQGLRYERAVGKALGVGWLSGQWFTYGEGKWGQWDYINPTLMVVVEVKYTVESTAARKLAELYLPVAECIWPGEWRGVVVAKNMVPGGPLAAPTIRAALQGPGIRLVHWLGGTPLW